MFVQKWFQKCREMNKKNVARNYVWTFAMHWKWTRFVEFDNYLWWNLGIYVWSGNQATINAVEVNIISKTKKSTHESSEVRGHVDCFLWYPGYCDGRVGTQWPDGKSQYYIEVLIKLHECVRRKRPELWRNRWILHQDNALSVKQF